VVHDVRYDLDALRSVGITRLISLTEEPFDAVLAAEFGISCLASPMPDMAPPTLAQGLVLCRAIDRALAAGEVVAVHCHAGLGRTGTVLAAYWLWRGCGRIGAPQALEDVRRIEPGWVQSESQLRFLEEFARVVANGGAVMASLSHDPEAAPVVAASVT
jgi:atypical dual specificity phosphatase